MKHWKRQLLKLDSKISKSLHINEQQKSLVLVLKIFAHSGDSWLWLAALVIAWIFSADEWRQRLFFIGWSGVIMAAIVVLLKFTITSCPEGDQQIYRITDPHSFPSGYRRSATLAC